MSQENSIEGLDLYLGAGVVQEVPPSMAKAGGDEAGGSLVMRAASEYSENETLSSKEDSGRDPIG